jgi:hypothetical protein
MTVRRIALATLLVASLVAVPVAAWAIGPPPNKVDPGIVDGSRQHRLDAARASWKAAGLGSYSYKIAISCFCRPRDATTVVVRGGRPAAKTPDELRDVATVPRLFRTIQRAIDAKVAQVTVTYGKRGVPKSIYIDESERIADEEHGYAITRFTPRKPSAR